MFFLSNIVSMLQYLLNKNNDIKYNNNNNDNNNENNKSKIFC